MGTVVLHKARYAGESVASKVGRVRAALDGADGLIVSDPHNLAWLFNIRGADVAHTPLALGFAYLPVEDRPAVFIDSRKLPTALREEIGHQADLLDPEALPGFVERLGRQRLQILFDVATAPQLLATTLELAGGTAQIAPDPITLMKASKNKTELAGARAAHARDGAAFVRFLAWFDSEAPRGRLTEIDAVKVLETSRRATGLLKDISFPTIAAAGPHSAVPHYRVSRVVQSQNWAWNFSDR